MNLLKVYIQLCIYEESNLDLAKQQFRPLVGVIPIYANEKFTQWMILFFFLKEINLLILFSTFCKSQKKKKGGREATKNATILLLPCTFRLFHLHFSSQLLITKLGESKSEKHDR